MKKLLSIFFALVLVLTLGLVTASPVAAQATLEVGEGKLYTTIQDAIDAAGSDATIIVSAGIYAEDLEIPADKSNLELKPATGESVTIKGVQNVHVSLWPMGAPNIEILADGVKIHGFTIQGPDYVADHYASGIILDGLAIEIYDNDFVTTRAEPSSVPDKYEVAHAITTISKVLEGFETANVSGLYIHDNTFTGSGDIGSEFIYINPHTGTGPITIDNNQFSGSTNMGITAESGNVIVSNNTISTTLELDTAPYGTYGMRFMDTTYGGVYDNIVVSGNDISGFERAIRVGNGQPGASVFTAVISSNTLTNNNIGVWGRLGNNTTVVDNSIAGNGVGVQNDGAVTINATNNWWGDASGPTHSSNPDGTGDAVSDNVDFAPWLGSLADLTVTTDVCTPPTTSLVVPGIVTATVPFNISGTTTNPADGKDFAHVRFNITLSGPVAFTGLREDTFTITYADAPLGLEGFNETFVLVDGSLVGHWGPAEGFPMGPEYAATSGFTVEMAGTAPVGVYMVLVELVDIDENSDVVADDTGSFNLSPLIGISLSPTSINFGQVLPGRASDSQTLGITNIGTVDVGVTAETESVFYNATLTIDDLSLVSAPVWSTTIEVGPTAYPAELVVTVPSEQTVGIQEGTIIFWVEDATTP